MALPRRIGLVVWGSLGDLHPFIAVALQLRALGLEPVIATHAEYRPKIEAEGILFHPVRPSFDDIERAFGASRSEITELLLRKPLWLYQKAIFPFLRQSFEDVSLLLQHTRCLVTSSPAIGARIAAEVHATPWLAGVLQPMMFLSAYDPPALLPVEWLEPWLRRAGPRVTRAALTGLRLLMNRVARPVHEFRREVGLPPSAGDPVFAGQYSAGGAVALYSPVIGAGQPDMPARTVITGFPFYDSEYGGTRPVASELEHFLGSGSEPIVFTLGSSFVHSPGSFYQESAAAARMLGRRAVLLVGDVGRAEFASLAAVDVHVGGYAPYSSLFPRAAALVHQGGIGTLGQALRSGRPQLIVPFFADQPDNAARAVRLGVARSIGRKRYTSQRTFRELGLLLSDERYRARAREVAAIVGAESGAASAAAHIARWMTGHPAP